jgi:pimeloyl-ACP methyl ester carboxylesterase
MKSTRYARRPCPRLATLLLAAGLAALLSACLTFRRYDMTRIHQDAAAMPRNPVIVIHGFLGSKMKNRHTQQSVWGRLRNAISRGKPDDLALPIDRLPLSEDRDDLVPYAICESVFGVKFYGAILQALREVGGYQLGDINNPKPDDSAFIYYYDWRRDNVDSAIGLGRAIRKIKARLRAPDLRFDIVAHSMGGYLAEYYLKYGMVDVLDHPGEAPVTYAGAADIARIVTIGTPHRGTMSAFRILNNGFARTMSPLEIFSMPSVYQLLPDDPSGHFLDMHGNDVAVDLYNARTWIENRWSIWSGKQAEGAGAPPPQAERFLQAALDRARAFHAALRKDAAGSEPPVPIHLFGSDCVPTLDRVVLNPTAEGTEILFGDGTEPFRNARELEKLMLAPGDGTVTADSLVGLAPAPPPSATASTFFFCATHGLLPANRGFQDNLFYVLLGQGAHKPAVLPAVQGG